MALSAAGMGAIGDHGSSRLDEARRAVLGQLSRRYGRDFTDHWEFVRFAREQKLDLDFTTPPKRP